MDTKKIPLRSEVPEEFTWNLKDMFPSDEAWAAENEALMAVPAQVAAYQGRLGESAETLLQFLREQDEIELRLSTLYGYASCKSDQDTGNAFYQDMRGKVMRTIVASSSAAAFSSPGSRSVRRVLPVPGVLTDPVACLLEGSCDIALQPDHIKEKEHIKNKEQEKREH